MHVNRPRFLPSPPDNLAFVPRRILKISDVLETRSYVLEDEKGMR